jgi:predicted patatin/cPLA2 family phospholipase
MENHEIKSIHNISFSGGGIKGIYYIGILRSLQEYGTYKYIKSWSGTSIGSFFAVLGCLEIPWQYLLNICMNTDIEKLVDIDINNFLQSQGMIKGNEFDNIVIQSTNNQISHKTTFEDLWKKTNKTLYICAYNVDKYKSFLFSHINSPKIRILDAIKASCSIPIIFPPKYIHGNYFYDGSTLETLPITHLPSLGTIGWELEEINKDDNSSFFNSFKFLKLLYGMRTNILKIKNNSEYIVYKIKSKQNFLNIFLSNDQIFNIFMEGYTNSKNQLYDNYIAIKPP